MTSFMFKKITLTLCNARTIVWQEREGVPWMLRNPPGREDAGLDQAGEPERHGQVDNMFGTTEHLLVSY